MDDSDDPYAILGVNETSSDSEIRSAYRKLALRHHPDKQTTEEDRQRSHALFAKISNAYEILGDPGSKRQYDGERLREQQQQQQHRQHQTYQEQAFANDEHVRQHHAHHNSHFQQFHFHDPMHVFQAVFGNEFGTAPRGFGGGNSASMGMNSSVFGNGLFDDDPFFGRGGARQQQQQQQNDPFGGFGGMGGFFGGGGMAGGFGGFPQHGNGHPQQQQPPDVFTQMNQQMEMMRQQMMQQQQQHQQQHYQQQQPQQQQGFFYSSSSSSSTSRIGQGGNQETISTTTRIVNGKRQTVTERIITKPDGTVERHVETTGDENFPAVEGDWSQQSQIQNGESNERRRIEGGRERRQGR